MRAKYKVVPKATALAMFERVANAKYDQVTEAEAETEYDQATVSARTDFDRVATPVLAEFERLAALAWEKRVSFLTPTTHTIRQRANRVELFFLDLARAKFKQFMALAAEYDRATAPAKAKYHQRLRRTSSLRTVGPTSIRVPLETRGIGKTVWLGQDAQSANLAYRPKTQATQTSQYN